MSDYLLPTNNALNLSNSELAQNEQNLDFWRDWYAKFNPPAQAVTSASQTPAYQGNSQAAQDAAKNMSALQVPGGSGNLDTGNLARIFNRQANVQGQGADLSNAMQDLGTNRRLQEESALGDLGRYNEQQKLGQLAGYDLPMETAMSNAKYEDWVNSLLNRENASQVDPLQTILGTAGKVLPGLLFPPAGALEAADPNSLDSDIPFGDIPNY